MINGIENNFYYNKMSAGYISLKKLVGNNRLLQTLQEQVLSYKHMMKFYILLLKII